jgi:cob(I)alamin adenosyltransferase
MKIYTRSGDDGTTGLFAGRRVAKSDQRIVAFGTVDELNAALGIARTCGLPEKEDTILVALQNKMFSVGAELATPEPQASNTELLQEADVAQVERWIDDCESRLPELKCFILPGGSTGAAWLHFCRCICRRAEREAVALAQTAPLRPVLVHYLNRVGDLLFVLARSTNAAAQVPDVPWNKES